MEIQPSKIGGERAYCSAGHDWQPARYEAVAYDIEVGGLVLKGVCARCIGKAVGRLLAKAGTYSETDPNAPIKEITPVSERWTGPRP